MIRRVVVFSAAAVSLGFLVLPIVAIFAHVSPGRLVSLLGDGVVRDALLVSLRTSAVAQSLVLLLGTPTALVLAGRFPGRSLLVALVELPLVLPPAAAGLGMLAAFGRLGLIHTGLPFTQGAVVLAVAFVSGPLYVRGAIAAFEALDANVIAASRTLGAGPTRTFFRVMLPLAGPGLAAGAALSLARGLGEFGATIMFAGSLRGVTQTLPLAVYSEFDLPNGFDVALALSGLLVVISAALLIAIKWRPSLSISRFRYAPSS